MNRHLNRGANLFLLILGMESIGALIGESFFLRLPDETWLWLGLLCLLLWISTSFRFGLLFGMPGSAAVFYYLYQHHTVDLEAQLKDVVDHVSAAYFGQFGSTSAAYTYESLAENHMLAVLLILFMIAAFVSTALISGSFRVTLALLATVPLFAVCIAVNGTPSVKPALGCFLFWCGLMLGGDVFRPEDSAGKALLFGLLPCLLVLGGLLLLYRPSTYVPSENDFSLSQRFDKIGNLLSEWMRDEQGSESADSSAGSHYAEAPSGWDSSFDYLDLTIPFDYRELDKEAFRLNTDASGSLYLRGRNFGDYTGTGWSAAAESKNGHVLSFAAQAVANSEVRSAYSFQLQSPLPYAFLYLPYYSISDALSDVQVPSDGICSYGGEFYFSLSDVSTLQSSASIPQSLQAEELQYRSFAHRYYTRLPSGTRTAMQEICRNQGFSAGQSDLLWRIADFVRSQGIYDVGVGAYPAEDYAVYFLTVSHRGYCIHYATAAAALYRSLDIPARVCEGYLVNMESGQTVTVRGYDAHAWVEVYLDGVGWIPVEVTASAAEAENQFAEGSVAPTPETLPEEPQDTAEESVSPEEQDDSADSDLPGEEGTARQDNSSESTTSSVWIRPFLVCLLSVLSLLALIFLRYLLMKHALRRRLSEQDGRHCAVNIYRQAERILRYGGEMPSSIRITAEKASFSLHEISEEELRECRGALDTLTADCLDGLTGWKKLCFRYFSANI